MKRFNMGVGTKIFGGFITLIIIGVVIGGAGYLSLNRVIVASGELNGTAKEAQDKDSRSQDLREGLHSQEERRVLSKICYRASINWRRSPLR